MKKTTKIKPSLLFKNTAMRPQTTKNVGYAVINKQLAQLFSDNCHYCVPGYN